MTKVILYIATSTDGFIADKDGSVGWLPHYENVVDTDEFGYDTLMGRISVIVMGNRSYLQILGFGDWAWPGNTTYVFTKQSLASTRDDIKFVNDDVNHFMKNLQPDAGQDIWLLGGAELIKSFAAKKLIDECIITVIPTTLGDGIKLELPYEDFSLNRTKPCSGGMEQRFYLRNKHVH